MMIELTSSPSSSLPHQQHTYNRVHGDEGSLGDNDEESASSSSSQDNDEHTSSSCNVGNGDVTLYLCCYRAVRTLLFFSLGVVGLGVLITWINVMLNGKGYQQGARYKAVHKILKSSGSCSDGLHVRDNDQGRISSSGWTSLGEPILDETGIGAKNMYYSNGFGSHFAVSLDGSVLAVSASAAAVNDSSGEELILGKVSLYEWKDDAPYCQSKKGFWLHTGDLIGQRGQHLHFGSALDISDDGLTLVVASSSGSQLPLAFLWEVYTREPDGASSWKFRDYFTLPQGLCDGFYPYPDVSLSADGKSMTVTNGLGCGFAVFNYRENRNDCFIKMTKHGVGQNYLTMSKMGNLVFQYYESSLNVYEAGTGELTAELALPNELTGYSSGFAANSDGSIFAAVGRSVKYTRAPYLKIYVRTGKVWSEGTTDLNTTDVISGNEMILFSSLAMGRGGSLLAVAMSTKSGTAAPIFVLQRQNRSFWEHTATLNTNAQPPVLSNIDIMKVVGDRTRPIILAGSMGGLQPAKDNTPGFVTAFAYN